MLTYIQTESNYVIFTDDPVRRYEEFDKKDFARTDDNLGIEYESDEIFGDTVLLLRYNCPDEDCDVACLGWPDLHRHVKSKHSKVMWYVDIITCVVFKLIADCVLQIVTFVLVTKRSLPMSMNYSPWRNCVSTKSLGMTNLEL